MDELLRIGALEQARLVRERAISSAELTQLYLERIDRFDGACNSFVTIASEAALRSAKEKDESVRRDVLPPFMGCR